MVGVKVSQQKLLMQQNFQVVLGTEYLRVPMIGTIDGTNKDFQLPPPYYPIYPDGEVNVAPRPENILVESLKTGVYTPVTVASLKSLLDPVTGLNMVGITELAAAPQTANATSMAASGKEQLEPVIIQSFEPTQKQDEKAEGRLNSTEKLYGYGSITTTVKSSMITSTGSIDLSKKLFNTDYQGTEEVEDNFDATETIGTPKNLSAMMIMTDPETDAILGIYKFLNCAAKPDLIGISDGKPGSFNLEFTVQKNPILLTPKV